MLKFTFELDKKVYQDSDAIKGRFALTNTGNTPILINKLLVLNRAFELDENRQVHLIIHNAQGDNFGFAGSIRMRDIEDSDFAELAPGQSLERVYDLKDYFLLPASSQYTIQAVYQNSLDPSNGSAWKGKQESETFSFEIK